MNNDYPMVISFYSGDKYYRDSAERLRQNCTSLNLDHDIVDLDALAPARNWADLCRYKVRFFLDKLLEHQRPILWVDVDTQIRKPPEMLRNCRLDMAGYIRNYTSARKFDPYKTGRFWSPGILFFGNSQNSIGFLEYVNKLEREEKRPATDDYFLNEAWTTFDKDLSIGILSEDTCAMRESNLSESTVFLHGLSGNVKTFKSEVLQHDTLFDASRLVQHSLLAAATAATKDKNPKTASQILRYGRKVGLVTPEMVLKEAYLMRLSGDVRGAIQSLEEGFEETNSSKVLRTLAELTIEKQDLDRARTACNRLVTSEDAADRAFGHAMMTRLGLEERAVASGVSTQQRIPLWWMETPYPGNFGDILNPYLIEKLTGIPPKPSKRGKGVLAIGSIIKFANQETTVWGSGTPRMTDTLSPLARYTAVRGPLTHQLVTRSGGTCPEIFGDPALLLPKIYNPKIEKRYKLGLIKHHVHEKEARPADDVLEINVMCNGYSGMEEFIDQVLSCERILTTSLHGLIVAHAYGIPARWGIYSKGKSLAGDDTKFQDHMLAVGLPRTPPLDFSELGMITPTSVDQAEFSYPHDLRLEPLLGALQGIAEERKPKPVRKATQPRPLTAQERYTSAVRRRLAKLRARLSLARFAN